MTLDTQVKSVAWFAMSSQPKLLDQVRAVLQYSQWVKQLHHQDLAQGYGSVYLPYALEHKYRSAEREWIWQYVFPADRRSIDPRSGVCRRHHLYESGLQKAVKQAIRVAGIQSCESIHIDYSMSAQPLDLR